MRMNDSLIFIGFLKETKKARATDGRAFGLGLYMLEHEATFACCAKRESKPLEMRDEVMKQSKCDADAAICYSNMVNVLSSNFNNIVIGFSA